MITLLARWLIKNRNDVNDGEVRRKYGVLCGAAGIVLNLFLFAVKGMAGILSGSIAIAADAFNNLSDAGSSLITLVGFRLAGQKPDPQHPFGHGRFEYISGLLVSMLILLMGFELGKSSVEKILHPEEVAFDWLTAVILTVSIAVKIYMALYNRSVGKKIHSAAMLATMTDSLGDAVATAVVLAATAVGHFTGLNIDGYCGVAVALMIFIAGFRSARETISHSQSMGLCFMAAAFSTTMGKASPRRLAASGTLCTGKYLAAFSSISGEALSMIGSMAVRHSAWTPSFSQTRSQSFSAIRR